MTDDVRERLAAFAVRSDPSPGVTHIVDRARRIRRRRRGGVAVLVLAGLVGAGTWIRASADDDGSPVDTVATTTTVLTTTTETGRLVPRVVESAAPVVAAGPPPSSILGGGPQLVAPWEGGLLVIGTTSPGPPLPSDGLLERLPTQMRDAIEAAGATTVGEAMDALDAAGLLWEATDLVMDDPELLSFVLSGTPEPYQRILAPGGSWEDVGAPLDVGRPGIVARVAGGGDQLVIASSGGVPLGDEVATEVVVIGSDGARSATWLLDADDLVVPEGALHEAHRIGTGVNVTALDTNADGWTITLHPSIDIDYRRLVSDEIVETTGGGFLSPGEITDEGITLWYFDDTAQEELSIETSWGELGMTRAEHAELLQPAVATVLTASWSGAPTPLVLPKPGCCRVAAGPQGFAAFDPRRVGSPEVHLSTNGQEWTPVPLPRSGQPVAMWGVTAGFVLHLVDPDDDASSLWLLDQATSTWLPVGLPDSLGEASLASVPTDDGVIIVAGHQRLVSNDGVEQVVVRNDTQTVVASLDGLRWHIVETGVEPVRRYSYGGPVPSLANGHLFVPGGDEWMIFDLRE